MGNSEHVGTIITTESWDQECKSWYERGKADYESGARISAPMMLRFEVRRAYMLGVAVACQFERAAKLGGEHADHT